MSTLTRADWIQKRARKAAQEFEKKGYQVSLNPASELLPELPENYRPHLMAQSDGETVMVEWITSATLMAETDRLLQIAQAVQNMPGWRLELRVNNAPSPAGMEPWNSPAPLAKRAIYKQIGEAQSLLQTGHVQAAWLVQWSATRAALCWLAGQEGLACKQNDNRQVMKQLFSLGVIPREAYDVLRRATLHGQAAVLGLETGLPEADLLQQLIQITIRLLME